MINSFHSQIDEFFSGLAPEELEKLISGKGVWQKKYFEKDTVIFAEDEVSSELYLLLSGHIEVSKTIRKNSKKVLAILDPGSIFGEGALLSDKPRAASAVALDDVECLMLTKNDFLTFLKNEPEAATSLLLALFKIVNQRLQWANQELVAMYDVSKMMHDFKGDIDKLLIKVGEKLAMITQAPKGFIALKNKVTEHMEVKTTWGGFMPTLQELEQFEQELGQKRHVIIGTRLKIAIKDLYGEFWGMIVLDGLSEWLPGPRKVARTTAEQVGIVIADYHLKESEAGRSKLKQQNVQF